MKKKDNYRLKPNLVVKKRISSVLKCSCDTFLTPENVRYVLFDGPEDRSFFCSILVEERFKPTLCILLKCYSGTWL